ncbi:amino acid permease [uncultured Arcticibacterium sp.]|uniref:amino acid permease n=1 Tax=uncultured Arcticibacterium sp. TaxID=2173042 RepID=UPI0030FCB93B
MSNPLAEKKLGAFAIWAIGVGLVISGESFGWNIGWSITGPKFFFIPVLLTAIMYYALIQGLIELACVYPEAVGPQTYVKNAFGASAGSFISLAILFEFLFATPAVASSLGEYLGFLQNDLSIANWVATIFIALFCVVNLFDLSISILFTIGLTILAILELTIYESSVISSFKIDNLVNNSFGEFNFLSLIKAMPFAIWLLLAIEGISLMTNNIKKEGFRKHLTRGYQAAFWTLILLAVSVLLLAGAGINWNAENWAIISQDNHPMPASLALILSKEHAIVQIFTFIGLFGLIASLQGVGLAATTQLETFLNFPSLSKKSKRALASFLVFALSTFAIWGSHTSYLIELSVFGAVFMYFGVSISLFKIRKNNKLKGFEGLSNDPKLNFKHSDFKKGKSILFSVLAALISLFCLLSLAYLQFWAFVSFLVLGMVYIIFLNFRKSKT